MNPNFAEDGHGVSDLTLAGGSGIIPGMEDNNLVFTPAQQRELHFLFGSIPNAGTMALRSPISFEDVCENLRRMSTFLERHGRRDREDRKELNELRRQRDAMRNWLGLPL